MESWHDRLRIREDTLGVTETAGEDRLREECRALRKGKDFKGQETHGRKRYETGP
jgi:hypothetical protein